MYLTEKEAAERLQVSVRHLQRLREHGSGPPWSNLAADDAERPLVRYRAQDIDAWARCRRVRAELGAALDALQDCLRNQEIKEDDDEA